MKLTKSAQNMFLRLQIKLTKSAQNTFLRVVDEADEVSSKHVFEAVDEATLTRFEEIFEEYKLKLESLFNNKGEKTWLNMVLLEQDILELS
ncbi:MULTISPECIES: hypothetical protein [unclassified Streptococcus]|uniref:hypothetical protein n=1 Tax=unclassified Streptococcus TaxID=2608887 RepID=UPI001566832A|nr:MULTISPECIES: hypothetical protein [unclassified Streptococcus]